MVEVDMEKSIEFGGLSITIRDDGNVIIENLIDYHSSKIYMTLDELEKLGDWIKAITDRE
jgi:hypothetical protein